MFTNAFRFFDGRTDSIISFRLILSDHREQEEMLLYTFFQLRETPQNAQSMAGHDVSSEPPESEHYF